MLLLLAPAAAPAGVYERIASPPPGMTRAYSDGRGHQVFTFDWRSIGHDGGVADQLRWLRCSGSVVAHMRGTVEGVDASGAWIECRDHEIANPIYAAVSGGDGAPSVRALVVGYVSDATPGFLQLVRVTTRSCSLADAAPPLLARRDHRRLTALRADLSPLAKVDRCVPDALARIDDALRSLPDRDPDAWRTSGPDALASLDACATAGPTVATGPLRDLVLDLEAAVPALEPPSTYLASAMSGALTAVRHPADAAACGSVRDPLAIGLRAVARDEVDLEEAFRLAVWLARIGPHDAVLANDALLGVAEQAQRDAMADGRVGTAAGLAVLRSTLSVEYGAESPTHGDALDDAGVGLGVAQHGVARLLDRVMPRFEGDLGPTAGLSSIYALYGSENDGWSGTIRGASWLRLRVSGPGEGAQVIRVTTSPIVVGSASQVVTTERRRTTDLALERWIGDERAEHDEYLALLARRIADLEALSLRPAEVHTSTYRSFSGSVTGFDTTYSASGTPSSTAVWQGTETVTTVHDFSELHARDAAIAELARVRRLFDEAAAADVQDQWHSTLVTVAGEVDVDVQTWTVQLARQLILDGPGGRQTLVQSRPVTVEFERQATSGPFRGYDHFVSERDAVGAAVTRLDRDLWLEARPQLRAHLLAAAGSDAASGWTELERERERAWISFWLAAPDDDAPVSLWPAVPTRPAW